MTPATTFSGRRVALFGLGGSGLATALSLKAGGAEVVAFDDSAAALAKAAEQGIATADLRQEDWNRFSSLVLSPGVPLTHPEPHWAAKFARAAGVEIIGDIEIFCRERAARAPNAPFVAITGTNGKSTTTALVAHILREAGHDVQMGGNIGTPILALEPPAEGRVHVVECSSFQIDLTPSLDPTIGVLLNLSPDHLDRHGTLEAYGSIKRRLVEGARLGVVGIDDPFCRKVYEDLSSDRPVIGLSQERPPWTGILYVEGGRLQRQVSLGGRWCVGEVLADLAGVSTLRGAHNGQNAAAAAAICEWLEVPHDEIAKGMRSFPGLPHRMEEVGRLGRVLFVNDSKATNADSTEKALASYPGGIHWILGGKAKEGGIDSLKEYFTKIEKAYLIGAASEAFAATLEGRVPYLACETLERAVAAAAETAAASPEGEPVVLLSPACASYDQFRNFEERGDRFRALVQALPGLRP
jgi:UDP-N-acetylmuramoylalanine--D-glutamate ligase